MKFAEIAVFAEDDIKAPLKDLMMANRYNAAAHIFDQWCPVMKVRLGELLVDAEIVSSADLTEAIQVSRRLGVPIGRVLLSSGILSQALLEAALEAQPLVNDGTLERSRITAALKEFHKSGKPIGAFLDIELNQKSKEMSEDRLGELLLDSDIVTQEQIDKALQTSFDAGVPLGSALMLQGVLSPSIFPSIIRIQKAIKEGSVSRDEGIHEIKSTFMHWVKADVSLRREMFDEEGQPQLLGPHDSGGDEDDENYVPPPASKVRKSKSARLSEASLQQILKKAKENEPKQEADEQLEPVAGNQDDSLGPPPTLVELLKEAGLFTQSDIQRAYKRVLDDPLESCKLLLCLGIADEATLKTALRCHSLREQGKITDSDAIFVIKASQQQDFEDQLDANNNRKLQRYVDPRWRKATFTRMLGGIAVGACVAGLSLFNKGKK